VSSGDGEAAVVSELELRLDRDARRWITRNLTGPNAGAEIWTHVFVVADRVLDIVVDFFVPNVSADAREKVGRAYAKAYEVLYDEDVDMMTGRQNQLDVRLDGVDESEVLRLDPRALSSLPALVTMSGRRFVVDRLEAVEPNETEWVVYPAQCPHQLGPLDEVPLVEGTVRCPWHGYVFDVTTGACVSGSHCQFGEVPQVLVSESGVTLCWKALS
jgi:nitrite reductase/ring-hydroxylating ferredoxin subunit